MVQTPSNRLKPYWTGTPSDEQSGSDREQSASQAWSERAAKFLGDRPIATLAASALVGLAVGWMVKRK
jgi:ElaB/YqjD/DUF883 family membrane-anchored ribosome-binding protein